MEQRYPTLEQMIGSALGWHQRQRQGMRAQIKSNTGVPSEQSRAEPQGSDLRPFVLLLLSSSHVLYKTRSYPRNTVKIVEIGACEQCPALIPALLTNRHTKTPERPVHSSGWAFPMLPLPYT